jgi:hypothetical protein
LRGLRRLQASFKESVLDYGQALDVVRVVGSSGYVGMKYV